jgi:hypothetical protein
VKGPLGTISPGGCSRALFLSLSLQPPRKRRPSPSPSPESQPPEAALLWPVLLISRPHPAHRPALSHTHTHLAHFASPPPHCSHFHPFSQLAKQHPASRHGHRALGLFIVTSHCSHCFCYCSPTAIRARCCCCIVHRSARLLFRSFVAHLTRPFINRALPAHHTATANFSIHHSNGRRLASPTALPSLSPQDLHYYAPTPPWPLLFPSNSV